jgi:hypothetical protein
VVIVFPIGSFFFHRIKREERKREKETEKRRKRKRFHVTRDS